MIQKIASVSQSSKAYWPRSAVLGDLVLEGVGDLVRRDLLVNFNRRHRPLRAGFADRKFRWAFAVPTAHRGKHGEDLFRYFTAWMRSQSALR